MKDSWETNWERIPGSERVGGQGRSFVAAKRDGSGERAFVKTMRRPKDRKARKRFAREVAAYETLEHAGLPNLIEHNRDAWSVASTPLYLVLEFVDGPTIAEALAERGPIPLAEAAACTIAIAEVVGYCHDNDVVHRDLKPNNVILRGADPRNPVVVDFGLSFNERAEDLGRVTRIGEEIGNRFLRVPEHATGGRDAASDITLLSALFLYLLTGIEPRVLVDEHGLKPHDREEPARILAAEMEARRLLRLQSLFDRAFEPNLTARFQSAAHFQTAIDAVMSPINADQDHAGLMSHLDEVVSQQGRADQITAAGVINGYLTRTNLIVSNLAQQKGLEGTQTGHEVNPAGAMPSGQTQLGLGWPSQTASRLVTFRFEIRSSNAVVLSVDGVDAWRGNDTGSADLTQAIERAAIAAFLGEDPAKAS